MVCGAPDGSLGAAQRYAAWLDCNARSLGEDGFLGLAAYVTGSGILTGLLTIMVALIGYRSVLGGRLDLAHGVNWAAKIGIVLALLTGWGAFQAVFYNLAIDAPADLAGRLALASSVPPDESGVRFQAVYDALRIGLEGTSPLSATGETVTAQPALPLTAAAFLLVAVGLVGAAKLTAGFLLAIAPLPIAAMLIGPGMGLFVGWARALMTVIFATAGLTLNALWCLLALESEVARMQSPGSAWPGAMDEQAPLAAVLIFFLLALAMVFASSRIARGLAENIWRSDVFGRRENDVMTRENAGSSSAIAPVFHTAGSASQSSAADAGPQRVVQVAQAFERNSRTYDGGANLGGVLRAGSDLPQPSRHATATTQNRRALGRRHRSSMRRDRKT